jgi:hypothetical protein
VEDNPVVFNFLSETTLLIRPLPGKAGPLIRPDFRCTEKVKRGEAFPGRGLIRRVVSLEWRTIL